MSTPIKNNLEIYLSSECFHFPSRIRLHIITWDLWSDSQLICSCEWLWIYTQWWQGMFNSCPACHFFNQNYSDQLLFVAQANLETHLSVGLASMGTEPMWMPKADCTENTPNCPLNFVCFLWLIHFCPAQVYKFDPCCAYVIMGKTV